MNSITPHHGRCSFCDAPKVEAIGTVQLCARHLEIVRAIEREAKEPKKPTTKGRRAAA